MADEYTLSPDTLNRIIRAVRLVETMFPPGGLAPGRRGSGGRTGERRLVEFTEDLTAGGTAQAKILVRTGPGSWSPADPERLLTVEDATGVTASTGDKAWVDFYGVAWYLAAATGTTPPPGDCVDSIGGVSLSDIPVATEDDLESNYETLILVEGDGGYCLKRVDFGVCEDGGGDPDPPDPCSDCSGATPGSPTFTPGEFNAGGDVYGSASTITLSQTGPCQWSATLPLVSGIGNQTWTLTRAAGVFTLVCRDDTGMFNVASWSFGPEVDCCGSAGNAIFANSGELGPSEILAFLDC